MANAVERGASRSAFRIAYCSELRDGGPITLTVAYGSSYSSDLLLL